MMAISIRYLSVKGRNGKITENRRCSDRKTNGADGWNCGTQKRDFRFERYDQTISGKGFVFNVKDCYR